MLNIKFHETYIIYTFSKMLISILKSQKLKYFQEPTSIKTNKYTLFDVLSSTYGTSRCKLNLLNAKKITQNMKYFQVHVPKLHVSHNQNYFLFAFKTF
jgi:hypothetical protein